MSQYVHYSEVPRQCMLGVILVVVEKLVPVSYTYIAVTTVERNCFVGNHAMSCGMHYPHTVGFTLSVL